MIMNDNMKMVVKALRSGEYKQTTMSLQDKAGYCCLGVMCAVFEKQTRRTLRKEDATGHIYGGDLDSQSGVQKWVGLRDATGESNSIFTLMELNDVEYYTFSEIADFIESEPKGLLVQ
jgi:hypothetical protein